VHLRWEHWWVYQGPGQATDYLDPGGIHGMSLVVQNDLVWVWQCVSWSRSVFDWSRAVIPCRKPTVLRQKG
jgi:hypothetical protein